jgi:hypothetical protein
MLSFNWSQFLHRFRCMNPIVETYCIDFEKEVYALWIGQEMTWCIAHLQSEHQF